MTRGQSVEVSNDASQRLNARDLIYPYLVGIFENFGYFTIHKHGDIFDYSIGFELHYSNIQLIYKIKNFIGVGSILIFNRSNTKFVRLHINNKKLIQDYIFPIFDRFPLLSKKLSDYYFFKTCFNSNIFTYNLLSSIPQKSVKDLLNLSYLKFWLVGYIEVMGQFKIKKSTNIVSFSLLDKKNLKILKTIKIFLGFKQKIKYNNCFILKVSNVRSIENVIKFLHKNPIKLLGSKKLEYLLFIKYVRKLPRFYSKFKIPTIY